MKTTTHPNYKQELVTLKVAGKVIATVGDVDLIRDGKSFAVRYGLQLKKRMTHHAAASEFGQCVIHQAQCEGSLS